MTTTTTKITSTMTAAAAVALLIGAAMATTTTTAYAADVAIWGEVKVTGSDPAQSRHVPTRKRVKQGS